MTESEPDDFPSAIEDCLDLIDHLRKEIDARNYGRARDLTWTVQEVMVELDWPDTPNNHDSTHDLDAEGDDD